MFRQNRDICYLVHVTLHVSYYCTTKTPQKTAYFTRAQGSGHYLNYVYNKKVLKVADSAHTLAEFWL